MSQNTDISFKKYSRMASQISLVFYIIYTALMWEVSFRIKYYYIILATFLLLSIHLICYLRNSGILSSQRPIISFIHLLRPVDYSVFAFFVLNCIWIFCIPTLSHQSIALAIQESGILLTMIVYFPLSILIRQGEIRYSLIKKTFWYVVLALSFWYSFIWVVESTHPGTYQSFLDFLKTFSFLKVGEVYKGWGVVRIVLGNCVILLPGLIVTITDTDRPLWLRVGGTFLITFAILSTFLKSIWVGVIVSFLILGIYIIRSKKPNERKSWTIGILTAVISVVVLDSSVFGGAVLYRATAGFSTRLTTESTTSDSLSSEQLEEIASGEVSNDVSSPFSDKFDPNKIRGDTISSNTEKLIQAKKLFYKWTKKPLLGFGYGSYIQGYLRSDSVVYAYEMTFFSLLMKIGVVGLLVWMLPIVITGITIFRHGKPRKIFIIWLAVTTGYLVSVQTNPLLFTSSSLSLLTYLLLKSAEVEAITEPNSLQD